MSKDQAPAALSPDFERQTRTLADMLNDGWRKMPGSLAISFAALSWHSDASTENSDDRDRFTGGMQRCVMAEGDWFQKADHLDHWQRIRTGV